MLWKLVKAGEDIVESTEPAPACCLDIEIAGERSWIEANVGVRTIFVAQPHDIVTEKKTVLRAGDVAWCWL